MPLARFASDSPKYVARPKDFESGSTAFGAAKASAAETSVTSLQMRGFATLDWQTFPCRTVRLNFAGTEPTAFARPGTVSETSDPFRKSFAADSSQRKLS